MDAHMSLNPEIRLRFNNNQNGGKNCDKRNFIFETAQNVHTQNTQFQMSHLTLTNSTPVH